jgi:hypothetical protein
MADFNPQQKVYRCRGLRRWCDQRCEVLGVSAPDGYPVVGHYCPLHSFQRPRVGPGRMFLVDSGLETHLKRRTSYVSSERVLGDEMARAPALRGTKSTNFGVTGADLVRWISENKGITGEALLLTLTRLLEQGVVAPVDKALSGKPFSKSAEYRVEIKAAGKQ